MKIHKLYYLVLIIFFSANYVQAQIKGKVIYKQTLNFNVPFVKEYHLLFNDTSSYYVKNIKRNIEPNNIEKINENGSVQSIKEYIIKDEEPEFYYSNLLKKQLIFQHYIVPDEPLLVIDSLTIIDWKISDETKKIGKFICQKAEGVFRGREYVVWFTSEIPVQYGPWKLNGLFGLILEAHDKDYKFHVIAKRVELQSSDKISENIIYPDTSKAILLREYVKRLKNKNRDVVAFLNSKLPKGAPKFLENCDDCGDRSSLEIFKEK